MLEHEPVKGLCGRKSLQSKVTVALESCAGSLPLLEGSVVKSVIFGGIQGETGAVTTKGFVLVLATSCSGPLSLLTFCKEDCAAFAAKVESEQFSAVHWVFL